jgi:hypothetical protein
MAQDDVLLERIAPGPYNGMRKWLLARRFSGVSRTDIDVISGCALTNRSTLVLSRDKSATIGVTDDEVLVRTGGRWPFETKARFSPGELDEPVAISERRDTAKENALASASLLAGGTNDSPEVQRADIELPNGGGKPFNVRVEKRTKSGFEVVERLKELFPDAAGDDDDGAPSDALQQLRTRYAAGEIGEDEFERRKATLEE